jgi:hypothetical protein
MARRRVRDDNEMVSILNVSHESSSDISSSDSDFKVSNAVWQRNWNDRGK